MKYIIYENFNSFHQNSIFHIIGTEFFIWFALNIPTVAMQKCNFNGILIQKIFMQ